MINVYIFSMLISIGSFVNGSTIASSDELIINGETRLFETSPLIVKSCLGDLNSETLRLMFESDNTDPGYPLMAYFIWPMAFCFDECYSGAALCCKVIIIVE